MKYMKILLFAILLGGLLTTNISAEKNITKNRESLNYLKVVGDFVEVPPFEIEVKLTKKAEERLKKDKESVVVMAMFTGDYVKNIPNRYKNKIQMGELLLFSQRIELTDKRVVKFDNLKFKKELYNLLSNKDIKLLINVYTNRKSTDVNLLNCDILQKNMSEVVGKRFIIKGKLIGN